MAKRKTKALPKVKSKGKTKPKITKTYVKSLLAKANGSVKRLKAQSGGAGACSITVAGFTVCTPNVTLVACQRVAHQVGGVPNWVAGGRCPG
jgi:hypothetical protein